MDSFFTDDLIFAFAFAQAVIALLLIRFLDLYEREPLALVALMFVWGAIGAAVLASIGNETLDALLSDRVRVVFGAAISAPIVEEVAKGLALVAVFAGSRWAHRRFGSFEFDGVGDGIVYGAAVGVGFAFTEDLYYYFREARAGGLDQAMDVFLDRRDFDGPSMLRHAIWTATFGAGLGIATHSRTLAGRIGWPVLGLALAMLLHGLNNGLVPLVLAIGYGFDATYDFVATGVPLDLFQQMSETRRDARNVLGILSLASVMAFFVAIVLWLRHQRAVIAAELAEERNHGLISDRELELAPSFWARNATYLQLLRSGALDDLRKATAVYRELVELAFAKRRRAENDEEVERRRERVRSLRDQRGTGGTGQPPELPAS